MINKTEEDDCIINHNESIDIKIPSLHKFKKYRVQLDEERLVTYRDKRQNRVPRYTRILHKKDHNILPQQGGIYLLLVDDEIVYVGQTKNFKKRMYNHMECKKNDKICFALFLVVKDLKTRMFYELLYQYHFLKFINNKITGWG